MPKPTRKSPSAITLCDFQWLGKCFTCGRKGILSYTIKLFLIAFIALVLSIGIWLGFIVSHYTVPILMYHYINDEEPLRSKLGVSPKTFDRQMRFLRENGYNIIPLEELADLIKNKKKLPSKTVAVTFDDGYLDNYTNVYPVLEKYHIPATLFIVINRIGKHLGNDDYMSWQQIKELSRSDLITIGSHSINHPNLSEIDSEDKLKYEIIESKRILEEALHRKINLFSYPFGGRSPEARKIVRLAGYKAAVGTNFPRGSPNDDVFALKRLRISENCKNMFIFWVETAGFYTYIKEQRDDY